MGFTSLELCFLVIFSIQIVWIWVLRAGSETPTSVCFPTQCLGQKLDSCWEFLGWKVGTFSPCYTNVHLFPAPSAMIRDQIQESIYGPNVQWSCCAGSSLISLTFKGIQKILKEGPWKEVLSIQWRRLKRALLKVLRLTVQLSDKSWDYDRHLWLNKCTFWGWWYNINRLPRIHG